MTRLQRQAVEEVERNGFALVPMTKYAKAGTMPKGRCDTWQGLKRFGLLTYHTGKFMGVSRTALGAQAACMFGNYRGRIARFDAARGNEWKQAQLLKGNL